MGDNSSADSSLIWLWIIEYLASSPEVNSSIVHELIDIAPECPVDLAKNTRERVALRCLEDLFGLRNGVEDDVLSTSGSKIVFDLSRSCEDVVQSVLKDTSASNLNREEYLLKWDIRPFIMHKRASMPKCALEQLRDKISEGVDPCAASLKEIGGLAGTDGKGDTISRGNGDITGHAEVIGESGNNAQMMTLKVNETVLPVQNDNVDAIDDSNSQNSLSSKRDRSSTEILVGNCSQKQCMAHGDDLHLNVAKRFRQSPGTVAVDAVQCNERESAHNADEMPESTVRDRLQQYVLMDEGDDPEPRTSNGESFEQKIDSEGEDDRLCVDEQEMSNSASQEGFHAKINVDGGIERIGEKDLPGLCNLHENEKADVAVEKSNFSGSPCMSTPKSLETADWIEQNLCAKCGKDGQFLACSSGDCQLVVHEVCLGSSATFNESGKFYCAFCVYAAAVSEYLEVEQQASQAKKELCAFFQYAFGT
ncbi:hypothetical protein Tsubulata_016274 [Turnera subulata]|uniref:PHD-type domain-containing protein n=1 Tax=Turnera subulata TaxID=218843 RepID=A0A9Q0J969_9ROSI|nr:hypothetical protein Tsubulata_016274 [Turnera subulata]